MAGTLERHPGLEVIVPHCGGALPVLADRVNGFMKLFRPSADGGAPDAVEQLRRLHYDMAGPAFPARSPRCSLWSSPAACCTAATTAGPRRTA
ncbi:hypothetical protein AB0L35_26635 [Streptomyces sp. NPDC052309]|uniref:hypothetical protein n=1 Tax=Streptomyces sp. NPDC052309 TaxID=3155421 RepID=UPI003440DD69